MPVSNQDRECLFSFLGPHTNRNLKICCFRHLKAHSSVRTFLCPICGMAFKRSDSLLRLAAFVRALFFKMLSLATNSEHRSDSDPWYLRKECIF